MSDKDPSNEDQTSEMTDEARVIIGRARRSFGFSMSILILGFMAIVLALVYRATKDRESAADLLALEEIALPASAEVRAMVPVNDVIAVTYLVDGQTVLRLVDGATGEMIREIVVVTE
ncbi:MAG TPA: hypothetical protein ENJ90_10220 [Devosia sp.]|nr:hypothetical protein [Devosia sp.]